MKRWSRFLYQPVLPLGPGGTRITGCREHIQLSRRAAADGMVLLKNDDGMLPLAQGSKIALFGKASVDYVKGGGGSGDVTVAYVSNLADGMQEKQEQGKVRIFQPLNDFYKEEIEKQRSEGALPGQTREPEIPERLLEEAACFADTAIISICRYSGEGWDRSDDDFYLTEEEKQMIDCVKRKFSKIAVVLNIGGMADTSWFKEEPSIQAALLGWQGGMEGGKAEADILCGDINPSGKLVDTFASCFEDYPSSAHFHDSDEYVEYMEDIYVGYRYFETIPKAGDKVSYHFGFGLSYTVFSMEPVGTYEQEDRFCFQIKVTNTGKKAGRETVMIYGSAPDGALGKPAKELKAFQKTRMLEPGESQITELSILKSDMASYDDIGIVQKSAWVLEKGVYRFYYGNDISKTIPLDFEWKIEEDQIVKQVTELCVPVKLTKRLRSDGSWQSVPAYEGTIPEIYFDEELKKAFTPEQARIPSVLMEWSEGYQKTKRPQLEQAAEGEISVDQFAESLSDEELCHLLGGQVNTGVANTWGIGNIPAAGVPNVMTADGPAGLRIKPWVGVTTTAWPCATLIACSFDPELAEEIGRAGGAEVKENNIGVWLTPALNIHRSPLCGRNFEYYSEDPYVAGIMGAAMVKGIQSNHIAASVKHFACNNKETNRKNSDSRVSERALREIYLKAFEIVIKQQEPWTVMSSYNLINGVRASENKDLLTGILREEWGYTGMVTTDWWNYALHEKEVLAGNDLKMAIGSPDRLKYGLEEGTITRKDLEKCAKRILQLILKLGEEG